MTTDEAAKLFSVYAESLRSKPDQFSVEVIVVGTSAVAEGGGTGLSVVNTGGGTGFVSTASIGPAQIRFGEGAASDAISKASDLLAELAAAAGDEDKSRFAELYGRLKEGATVPAVLLSSVEAIGHLAHLLA